MFHRKYLRTYHSKTQLRIAVALAGALLALGALLSCTDNGPKPSPNPKGALYVLNQNDATMYVFNTSTLAAPDTIPTIVAKPHFVTFSPDGLKLYISTLEAVGRVARFDSDSLGLEATLSFPGVSCSAVDIATGNNVGAACNYNLAYQSTRVYLLNPSGAMAITDSVNAGASTHDVSFTSDGSTLIAANMYSDNVTIVDLTTSPPTSYMVPMDPANPPAPNTHNFAPKSILILPGDQRAVVACHAGHQLKILDIPNRLVIDSIMVGDHNHGTHTPGKQYGPGLMALGPDNDVVWVSGMWDNKIWGVRLSTKTVFFTANTSTGNPFGVAVSDDGRRVYVTATGEATGKGRLYIIDSENGVMMDSITLGALPYGLAWRPLP